MMLIRLPNISRGIKIINFGPNVIQSATLTSRSTRGSPLILPKPFPYQEKKLYWYHKYLDPTIVKVSQENAKIIVVEGPIGVGKTAFCKALAEEFDMHYIPQPTMDLFYLLPSGYDLRQHDDELPEELRSYDHKNFCVDPTNFKAFWFQFRMLFFRFYQYLDALCHLLNTGQGVILERSYFSDYVFMNAMYEQKFLSKAVLKAYNTVRKNTSTFFMSPHLIIYLDIPVPVVQERIRTRNYSYEQNSPALTKEYLTSLERNWKEDYLIKASKKSEILIYDWSEGGDVDVVIDDIEKIDFDIMRRDKKFKEWWINRVKLFDKRKQFTNSPQHFGLYFYYPFHRIDEIFIDISTQLKYDALLESLPECQYDVGYNYLMGDSIWKILFKTKTENHRHLKSHLVFRLMLRIQILEVLKVLVVKRKKKHRHLYNVTKFDFYSEEWPLTIWPNELSPAVPVILRHKFLENDATVVD